MSRPNWRTGKVPSEESKRSTEIVQSSLSLSSALRNPISITASNSSEAFSTNPKESTACVFFEVCLEFAKACAEVWPSDEHMCAEATRLDTVAKTFNEKQKEGLKLAKLFHESFSMHYSKVVSKDASLFSVDNEVLKRVNAANKFASSPQDVRDTIWEHLRSLVQYAGMVDMYSKCPQAMLDSISGVASGLIAKLQNGQLDTNSLNPLQLGQMMMQEMSASDLEGFGSAILEGGNMDSMMSIMQSTMGSLNGGFPGFPGNAAGGVPDLSMLSELFRNQ